MKKLITVLLLFQSYFISGQKITEPVNSAMIYETAMELRKENKLKEALDEFEKVPRNDTNYYAILVEKTIVLLELEKFDEAIVACKEGIELNSTESHNFFINMGVTYNRSKKPEEALKALDEGISKFPKNYLMHYNKAIVYKGMGKLPEALDLFKQSIMLNPYHSSSHLNLAVLAAEEGNLTQAMLSYNMFLLLYPGEKSNSILQRLNEIVSSKYSKKPTGLKLSPKGTDDFSELDLLISNYSALSKGFKVPVKSELPVVKQNYALFSKLQYDSNDKGFWMQTYVPFFKELVRNGWFDEFTYYLLQASTNEKHTKLVNKNAAGIKKFAGWATLELDKIHSVRPVDVNGKTMQLEHWYDEENHTIKRIGNKNSDKSKFTGYNEEYFRNGRISSKGYYDELGKQDGLWLFYYSNGAISEEDTFKNGKVHGNFRTYYENGNKKREGFYSDGVQVGLQNDYNRSGLLTSSAIIKDNDFNGKFTLYYDLGKDFKSYDGIYVNGKLNDSLFEYYDNGAVASRKKVKDNLGNGEMISYYRNGKIKSRKNEVNGIANGEFKEYFHNGKLRQEGSFKEGAEIGWWKSYYSDGSLEEEIGYDEKGKKNGISKSYDTDGKIYLEIEYSKGDIIAYKYFDKNGKIIKEDKKKKGDFDFIGYYANGIKRQEGSFGTNGKYGLWKYYDEFGNLSSEEYFNDKGLLQGNIKNYYRSKQIQSEISYKDGEMDGLYLSYYPDGKLETEGWARNGEKESYWINYWPDGALKSILYYTIGKISGFQQYYSVTGKLYREEYYHEGVNEKDLYYDTTGKVSQTILLKAGCGDYNYYFDGTQKISFSGKYIAGQAHGEFTWFHSNGKVFTKGSYHNDKRHGKWIWHDSDGNMEKEGEYFYGNQQGKWTYYFPNGKIEHIDSFENDLLEGKTVWYYENGHVEMKKQYKSNEEDGAAYYYDPSGELQHTRTFRMGIPVSYSYKGTDGKMVPEINIENGTYKFISYFANGKKSKEYEVVNGDYVGKYSEYYADGKIRELKNYEKNLLYNDEIIYYPDGKTESEKKYFYGDLDGPAKEYYPNGTLKKSMNYKSDKPHGTWLYYDKNGKKTKETTYYSGRVINSVTY